jgi:dTDP-4-dehydrorhamnose 3,5-epimerase-like enzyme
MNQEEKPVVIAGGLHADERGNLGFVNALDFSSIKRFYHVQNSPDQPIRAFQCHFKEAKYAYVIQGAALFVTAHLDTFPPAVENVPQTFLLSASKPEVVYIPPSYANGFKSLTPDTLIIFFSTCTLAESQQDDKRLPWDYWGTKIWETDATT